jgi:hypothetical protein
MEFADLANLLDSLSPQVTEESSQTMAVGIDGIFGKALSNDEIMKKLFQ